MDPIQQQPDQSQPQSSGDSRATHVYVAPQINSGGRPQIGLPNNMSTPETAADGSGGSQASVSVKQPQPQKPYHTGPQINWGGVAKGVAIVAGVVLVGVVGAWLLSSAVPMIMMNPLGAQVMTGLATGAHTVLDIGAGVGEIAFSSLTTAASGFGAGFGIPAITSTAPFLWVSSTMGSIAAWVGGIGATLMALPHALHGLAGIHLMDPGSWVTPPATGGADVTAAAAVTAGKTATQSQMVTQNIHPVAHHGGADLGSMPDPSDSMVDDEALQVSNKAMKVVHHAAEDSHEYRHERNARMLLARTAQANRSWADRVAPASPEPVLPAQRPPIQPRSVNYADQAELEKQLQMQAEGSRA